MLTLISAHNVASSVIRDTADFAPYMFDTPLFVHDAPFDLDIVESFHFN